MAMVSMESRRTPIAPAKAFFSICFTLTFFYGQPISKLLEEDLEVVLFWSGIVLVVLSIIPLAEWGLKAVVKLFDWRLPHKATTYWETMTRPSWESFLNNTIRDLYLIGALLSITGKTATDHDFFDQDILGISVDANWLIILVSCLFLVLILVTTLYDRYLRHAGDIRLTQRYLTTISKESLHPDKQDEYYSNRVWELFRRTTIPQIEKAAAAIRPLSVAMLNWASQGPSKTDDFANWGDLVDDTRRVIYKIKPETIPPLAKRDPGNKLLKDLEKLRVQLHTLPKLASAWWSHFKPPEDHIMKLLSPHPDWAILSERREAQLLEATEQFFEREQDQGWEKWTINEQWVESFYQDIEAFALRLEEYGKAVERYLQSLYNKSVLWKLGLRV
ncbi:MAG: hypothetical protein ACXAB4_11245 [Candidatus Hodarchaeales archaeon]|jgi:hypothetical protein